MIKTVAGICEWRLRTLYNQDVHNCSDDSQGFKAVLGIAELQNESPQVVLLWHVDYFEPKATETPWAQEELLLPHFDHLEEFKFGVLSIK